MTDSKQIEFELRILPDGRVQAMYQDGVETVLRELGGNVSVSRASTVEFEKDGDRSGWVVRSCKDPEVALRSDSPELNPEVFVSRRGYTVMFQAREEAVQMERLNFWNLLNAVDNR